MMRSNLIIISLLLLALNAPDSLQAQGPMELESADSVFVPPAEESQFVHPTVSRRSPTGALLRSAAVPGWGQFYNRKYIKGLVVAAGETLLIYNAIDYWKKADDSYDEFSATDNPGLRSLYYTDYEFYADRRELFLWLSGVTIFLSMIDAYVDAHLAGFDVDVTPSFEEDGTAVGMLSLTYRF